MRFQETNINGLHSHTKGYAVDACPKTNEHDRVFVARSGSHVRGVAVVKHMKDDFGSRYLRVHWSSNTHPKTKAVMKDYIRESTAHLHRRVYWS